MEAELLITYQASDCVSYLTGKVVRIRSMTLNATTRTINTIIILHDIGYYSSSSNKQ